MSVDPPAANGTTMRIGRCGYRSCACASPAHSAIAISRAKALFTTLEQHEHRAAAAGVARRFAVREHVVPVREPAAHLALEHRLLVRRRQPLAVDHAHAAQRRARAPRRGNRQRVVRLVDRHAVQVELAPAPTSGRGAACPRARRCRGRGARTSARARAPGRCPTPAAPARRRTSTPASASRSSAMRWRGTGAGRGARDGGLVRRRQPL